MSMNPEIKARWVSALQSGEYQQGDSVLHSGNEFCCLGVLCDLYVKEGLAEWSAAGTWWRVGDSLSLLPPEVIRWAGLPDENPTLPYVDESDGVEELVQLSCLNDNYALPFPEIAALIQDHL